MLYIYFLLVPYVEVYSLSTEPWFAHPLSPLSVAGFPQGAARGEALERAHAYGRAFAGGVVDAFYLCASVCIYYPD